MVVDNPIVRVIIKSLVLVAAGASGFLSQRNLPVSISLFALSVILGAADYLLSHRIATLVMERIAGILEAAYRCCSFAADADVRATVFTASPSRKDTLRQIGGYYPTNRYSSYRRGLPTSKGIIGLCFRSQQRCVEVIKQEASFKSHLVAKWGFTNEEADRVKIRRSYLAIPLFDAHGKALGVAYFDSAKEDTFSPEAIDMLANACVPLCKWVR